MQVLYFGWVRARVGVGQEEMPLPDGVDTLGDLAQWLQNRGDGYAVAFKDIVGIRAAVNHEIAALETRISDGDEVAFFPPMTGG